VLKSRTRGGRRGAWGLSQNTPSVPSPVRPWMGGKGKEATSEIEETKITILLVRHRYRAIIAFRKNRSLNLKAAIGEVGAGTVASGRLDQGRQSANRALGPLIKGGGGGGFSKKRRRLPESLFHKEVLPMPYAPRMGRGIARGGKGQSELVVKGRSPAGGAPSSLLRQSPPSSYSPEEL